MESALTTGVNNPALAVCQRLRALRLRSCGPRGKRKFASALGLPLSTYCAYEVSRQAPADILVRAAEVTACDLEWLLTGEMRGLASRKLSAEEAGIVQRLAALIDGRPEAKQAMEALADLLGEAQANAAPSPGAPVPATDEIEEQTVIPIIGRTAAGQAAFWQNAADAGGLRDLRALARDATAVDPVETFAGSLTTARPPYAAAGDANVIRFAHPRQVRDVLVDGVIVTTALGGHHAAIAVQIDGDSMIAVLDEGDYVIADPGQPAVSGHVAVAMIEGQIGTTCKVYVEEGREVRLVPMNRAYQAVTVPEDQVTFAWRVIGAVRRRKAGPPA